MAKAVLPQDVLNEASEAQGQRADGAVEAGAGVGGEMRRWLV